MREILFRAKIEKPVGYKKGYNIHKSDWVKGSLITGYERPMIVRITGDRVFHREAYWVDPKTVGQYTGLEDKNVKDIFEGDIVSFFGMRGIIVQECGAFGIVGRGYIDYGLLESKIPYNINANFCFCDTFISLWELWFNYEQDDNPLYEVEVIGNIYDNPELLRE